MGSCYMGHLQSVESSMHQCGSERPWQDLFLMFQWLFYAQHSKDNKTLYHIHTSQVCHKLVKTVYKIEKSRLTSCTYKHMYAASLVPRPLVGETAWQLTRVQSACGYDVKEITDAPVQTMNIG